MTEWNPAEYNSHETRNIYPSFNSVLLSAIPLNDQ